MVSISRVALVTGSSRGLGAAIARNLADAGYQVVVNGTDSAEVETVVDGIRDSGGQAVVGCGDVTNADDVVQLTSHIETQLGPVHVLVLNATGPQPEARLAEVTWTDHQAQLDYFVKSPILLGAALIPGMRSRRFGRIINIDSDVADRPPPRRSAYATAKNAQIGLTRAWAVDLAPDNITVNSVAPAFIPVERHTHIDRTDYLARVPIGRMGIPEDVAHTVRFFASDSAGFITGQRIIVDGGRSLNN